MMTDMDMKKIKSMSNTALADRYSNLQQAFAIDMKFSVSPAITIWNLSDLNGLACTSVKIATSTKSVINRRHFTKE
tara:strand:- start:6899 stop:7126 length:228 start_codon:yes stop_codon:yes gene_type:complete